MRNQKNPTCIGVLGKCTKITDTAQNQKFMKNCTLKESTVKL